MNSNLATQFWVFQGVSYQSTTSWWLNHPIEKCARQNGFIFPNFRGENTKHIETTTIHEEIQYQGLVLRRSSKIPISADQSHQKKNTCALIRKKQWETLLVNNRQQLKESHPTPIISHPTPICSSETNQLPLLSLSCQRIALPTCRHHGTIRHEGSRVSMAPTWGARNTRAPISTPLGVLRIQFRKACTIGYWWLAEKSTCGCCRPFFVFLCNGWSSEGCGVLFMQTFNVLASMLAVNLQF